MIKINSKNYLADLTDDEATVLLLIGTRGAFPRVTRDFVETMKEINTSWRLDVDVVQAMTRLIAKDMVRYRSGTKMWYPSPAGIVAIGLIIVTLSGNDTDEEQIGV